MKSLNLKKIISLLAFAGLMAMQACTPTEPVETTYTGSLEDSAQIFNVGKTVFNVVIADQDGTATSGLAVEVEPEMDMGTFTHNTPVESIVDNGDGSYTVTAYFLMSGDWMLHFHVDGVHLEEHLMITVGGAMMDKRTLKGITDMIMPEDGGTAANRPYIIFVSSLDVTTGDVDLYLATRDNYTSHPAVYAGQSLIDETGASWNVGTVTVEVCTIADCSTRATLFDEGNGHFTATGIGDISFDSTTMMDGLQFGVRVFEGTTNESKTTDGLTATMMNVTSHINQ
jgi:hypothetical protein